MNFWAIVTFVLLAIIGSSKYEMYQSAVAEREWRGANGFNYYTTAEDVSADLDLTGKVALVTGANSGIGFETARVFALRKTHTIVVARTMNSAIDAIERLKKQLPKGDYKMTPLQCDLSSLKSVDQAAKDFKALNLPLHYLIANAGVMGIPTKEVSVDGYEKQVAVNHLGHFHLVNSLLGIMEKSAPSRFVAVSSEAHTMSTNPRAFLESENFETMPYTAFGTYGDSKLANIILAKEFNERYKSKGVLGFSVHPGIIGTNLGRSVSLKDIGPMLLPNIFRMIPLSGRSIPQGAGTQMYAAVRAPESEAGLYLNYCNVGMFGSKYKHKDGGLMDNSAVRAKFWATSEKLVKQALAKK